MKNFDSFYFLHIQKTAGRLYVYNFLEPLNDILLNSGIKNLNNRINSSDHSQWRKDITDSTYLTTIFRDPCKQVISLYVHGYTTGEDGSKKIMPKDKVSTSEFFLWFNKNILTLKNYQSKNIITPTIQKDESFFSVFANNNQINKKDVFDRIKKFSLILKPEDLKESNTESIQQKILSDLNIFYKDIKNNKYNREEYRSLESEHIYSKLTEKEKSFIRDVSSIDSEVYENKAIFWNP